MKSFHALTCIAGLTCSITLQAAFLPIEHLDSKTVEAYQAYIEKFEREVVKPYAESGKLWIDASACCVKGSNGKAIVEARNNDDVAGGSIHHFSGTMHIDGATIEDMRRVMEDYPNYPKNFKPDVTKASGVLQPDSSKADDHFVSHLTLSESTLWMGVQFETTYDTHYRWIDEHRWASKSVATDIQELKDAKDPSKGMFPQGDDHGFLWRTQTYWFVRQSNGGLDLQLDSISLARPNVPGFTWFGSKRSHDAVEKMLRDARTAIVAMHK
jgi:hypothetical protein